MNRNVLVTVAVVILIVLATGYYFMNRSTVAPVNPSTNQPEASINAEPSVTTEKTSLKNFMSMAGDQKCDFNDIESGSSGTVYLNSGKMRGDFSSKVGDKVTPSHMINDGKDIYIWMDDQATGFKTSLSAIEAMSGQTGVSQTMDINKEVDYSCSSWGVDPVKFTVPTDIKFQDMGAMMQNMQGLMSAAPNASGLTGTDMNAACAACDNLEGDSQAQCKRALKCN